MPSFSHVTALSPEFSDRSQSGEIVSRLSSDATQIKSVVRATASVALRNMILGIGAAGDDGRDGPRNFPLWSLPLFRLSLFRLSPSGARCAAAPA